MFAMIAVIKVAAVLFRRIFPARISPLLAGLSASEKSHLFALDEGVGAIYVLFVILSIPTIMLILYFCNILTEYLRPAPDAGFFLPWYCWFFVAFPAGFVAAYYIVQPILRRELGPEYEATAAYDEALNGFDINKAMNYVIAPCVLTACALLIVLGISFHVSLYGQTFTVHDFFSLRDRTYALDQITNIFTAPSFYWRGQRVVHRRIYVVFFKDGTSWNTRLFSDNDQIRLGGIIRQVAARARITIAERRVLSPSIYDDGG